MICTIVLVGDGPARRITPEEATAYEGAGFIWTHVESDGDEELPFPILADIPEVAANALVATETRPRCDRIGEGAIVNIRGPSGTANKIYPGTQKPDR